MKPTARASAALLSLAALVAAAPAQDKPAPPPPRDGGIVEKVDVRLLTVPIAATDRQGRPITDLKAEDVVVKYRGEKVRIAYLERFRRADAGAAPAEVPARLFLDLPGGWPEPIEAVKGNPEYWLFFVDLLNDPPLRRDEALLKSIEYVRSSLRPNVVAGVAVFDGEIHLEVPFTPNREAVVRGLEQAWGRRKVAGNEITSRTRQLLDRMDDCVINPGRRSSSLGGDLDFVRQGDEGCIRDVINEHVAEKTPDALAFLAALRRAVEYAGGLEGRKVLVALSHGVIADTRMELMSITQAVFGQSDQASTVQLAAGFGAKPQFELDRIAALAQRLKVTVYFADRYPAPTRDSGARGERMYAPGSSPYVGTWQQAQADMEEITSATGGIVAASPRIEEALAKIGDALEGGYEVGFYVDSSLITARTDSLRVSSNRGGVRIHHRREFQAPALASEPSDMSGRIALGERESSAGPIPLQRVAFTLFAPAKQLGYRLDVADMLADLTVGVSIRDAQGAPVVESYNLVRHSIPAAVWTATPDLELEVKGWVELPPGRYTLVARFRNTETGWSGQLVDPLTIPTDTKVSAPDARAH